MNSSINSYSQLIKDIVKARIERELAESKR